MPDRVRQTTEEGARLFHQEGGAKQTAAAQATGQPPVLFQAQQHPDSEQGRQQDEMGGMAARPR